MDFSHAYIAIRQRKILELFDLALRVYFNHRGSILILMLINVIPLMIINGLLLMLAYRAGFSDAWDLHWMLLLLIVNQAQISTMLISQYLGKAMFTGKPTVGSTLREAWSASKRWIWLHGLFRMAVPVWVVLALGHSEAIPFAVILILLGGLIVWARPFVNEISFLERPELTGTSFRVRSQHLHASEVAGGFIMTCFLGPLLMVVLASSLFLIDEMIGFRGQSELTIQFLYWPIALLLTISFTAVFRFLFYIDTRISQEGWEVKLQLMIESQKLLQEEGAVS